MKHIITFLIAFLISISSFAQNGINYKAVIKDNLGNVVANQSITVRYSILKTTANGTQVYQETQVKTTDANGIVIANIGEGTPVSGNYSTIAWGSDSHFLKTEVKIGSNAYVNMGTTQFMAVPYALSAADKAFSTSANVTSNAPGNIATDDFVIGSTQLAHMGSFGVNDIRLFFDKSLGAFRVGATNNLPSAFPDDGTAWNDANIGFTSFASGQNTAALGGASVAMGRSTKASGSFSTALGLHNNAEAYASTAIGLFNVGGGIDPYNPIDIDPLFEIGNGTDENNRANALTILKNGRTTINGITVVYDNTPSTTAHAISGIKNHTGLYDTYGVYGQNTVADYYGVGVYGEGGYIGTLGLVGPSGTSSYFGVYGLVEGINTGGTNYGIYGRASSSGATNYAVYASGDLGYTGALINASDRKIKVNISGINEILGSILRLKPSTYLIKESYQKSINASGKPQFGFVAQELQEVFPDLVSENFHPGVTKADAPIKYLGVNYIGLISILTAGMQEQQQLINSQNEMIIKQSEQIMCLKKDLLNLSDKINQIEKLLNDKNHEN